jgi:hypothetical protein
VDKDFGLRVNVTFGYLRGCVNRVCAERQPPVDDHAAILLSGNLCSVFFHG